MSAVPEESLYDVAVIGAGYVGVPLAATFAEAGQRVLVVDVQKHVVDALNRGESHIEDISSERMIVLTQKGLILATNDYEQVKAQRDSLLRQKAAIKKLQDARSGPAFLMRELSDILTKGKGPTIVREEYDKQLQQDPNAGYNPNWEPKRCWLLQYAEKEGVATIRGGAKSSEDVAEFLKRLKLSAFFSDVYWKQTQPQVDAKASNVTFVVFDVTARVHY